MPSMLACTRPVTNSPWFVKILLRTHSPRTLFSESYWPDSRMRVSSPISKQLLQSFRKMSTTTATSVPQTRYILSFYVPQESTSAVMSKVCQSGAGSYPGGLYTEAYWITSGTGQFRPNKGANPAIGTVGEIEKVAEHKVEVLCLGKECVKKAVEELIKAHPYEEVPYYIIKSEEI